MKDSLSKNVMAYLSDFKPFIEKSKEEEKEEEEQRSEEDEIRVQTSEKGYRGENNMMANTTGNINNAQQDRNRA